MDKVENSARKTGRDQFLVGCQCEKEGDKSLFSYIQQNNISLAQAELAERGAIVRFKDGKR
jgi:hypothetical protein